MNTKMNLWCLFCCWCFILTAVLGADTMTHKGIMQVAKKSVIAKDMLHILKTIFQNAKFWDYPDIKEEEKSGAFSKGLYLTDIDVVSVDFDQKPLVNSLTLTPEAKKVTLSTTQPALKYTFTFNWRAEAMGVHIAFGHGNATMTSKNIVASYGLTGMTSELEAKFDVAVIEVTGAHSLVAGVKDWIARKLSNETYSALLKGIDYNRHFIAEYMHIQFAKLTKRINDQTVLQYVSHPANVAESGDYIFYSHDVELYLNGEPEFEVTQETPVALSPISHDMGIYLSPQLIPLTIDIHGILKKCNGEFDMTLLGLTGTVRDFFEPLPELVSTYNGNEKLKMFCEYAYEKLEEQENQTVLFPVKCSFKLAEGEGETSVLEAKVQLKMKYQAQISSDVNQLYAATMAGVAPQKCASNPQSADLNLFLMRLFREFGRIKFEGKILEVPMIRYEPYRDYDKFVAGIQDGSYVAYYNELSSSY